MLVYQMGSFLLWFSLGFFGSGTEDIGGSVLWTQRRWGCTRHPYASTMEGWRDIPPGPEIPGVHTRFSSSKANSNSEKSLHEKHVAMEMRSQKTDCQKKTGNVIGLHDDINQTNKGRP